MWNVVILVLGLFLTMLLNQGELIMGVWLNHQVNWQVIEIERKQGRR